MEKLFRFIDRVNALAFFTGVVLAAGLLLWATGNSLLEGKAKTSVVVPNASTEKSEVLGLSAWEFIPEIGVQVFKLQSNGSGSNEYSSGENGTRSRNLLFVKISDGTSKWLYSDQSHVISRLEKLNIANGQSMSIFLETSKVGNKSPSSDLLLVSADGSKVLTFANEVVRLLTWHVVGENAIFFYQTKQEIQYAVVSMKSFKSQDQKIISKLIHLN